MRPLVAFCGIDGAGKSTLIQGVLADGMPASVFKKEDRKNADRLLRLSRLVSSQNPYLSVRMSGALRVAYAFDFLRFYQDVVHDSLAAGTDLVFLDRWTPCLLAWAAVPGSSASVRSVASVISATIPAPNAIVYVDLDPAVAIARIGHRGLQKLDEDLDVLGSFRAAYEEILPLFTVPTLRLQGDWQVGDNVKLCSRFLIDLGFHRQGA